MRCDRCPRMMTPAKRAADQRYQASAKGKAAKQRYASSEKGRINAAKHDGPGYAEFVARRVEWVEANESDWYIRVDDDSHD